MSKYQLWVWYDNQPAEAPREWELILETDDLNELFFRQWEEEKIATRRVMTTQSIELTITTAPPVEKGTK